MRVCISAALALSLLAAPAFGATLRATPASFLSVLNAAKGGDVVQLAPGTYSNIRVSNRSFSPEVTITSADPAKPAVLTDLIINSVKGLRFTRLDMAARPGNFAYEIKLSENVHFDRVKVHGVIDGNVATDPSGIGFSGGRNIGVTNSEFLELGRGAIAISTSTNVTVSGNHFHDLRSDGVNFAQVSDVKVTHNVFRTFSPSPTDHPDAIQFWTTNTKAPSTDILISGNVILRGDGQATQAIFMRDEVGTLPYERVTISNNLIVGTGYNGIRIMGAKDLRITGNTLVSHPGDTNRTYILVQDGDLVSASDNSAVSITFERTKRLTKARNLQVRAASDRGKAAVEAWIAARPGDAAKVGPLSRLGDLGR